MSIGSRAALAAATVILVAGLAGYGGGRVSVQPEARWFMPGELGAEPGRLPAGPGARAFRTRAFSGIERTKAEGEWGRRNALTPALSFSHNLGAVFAPKLHATRPEFFPMEKGRRIQPPEGSYFWNPDIAREDAATFAAEAAREYFRRNPHAPSFALGTNDGLVWGESPELRALAEPTRWFRERPDYSPVVFTFMNRVAKDLERTHPEKYVGALAYYWSENLPAFPLHPRVLPFLTADRAQGYDPVFRAEELALKEKWGAAAGESAPAQPGGPPAGRRLGIYDYVYGHGFLVPRTHTALIAEHLRQARRAGFTDYYAEVNPNWGLDGPMPWLVAQMARDPEQDPAALLDDYFTRYFAEAAEPMRRFFARCEERWMAQPGPSYWLKHYRNESQAVVYPPGALAELRALLAAAGAAARTPRTAARVRFVADAFGVSERFVRFQRAREGLLRAALSGPGERARVAAARTEYEKRRSDFIGYTRALQAAQPLAVQRFDWSDYLKNDPLPTAAAALGEAAGREVRPLLAAGNFAGPLQPARVLVDIPYGIPLPAGWQSRVEPAERHRGAVVGEGANRVLRIDETRDTIVQRWEPLPEAERFDLAITVRGRVSTSAAVSAVLAFLDEKHRHLGVRIVRLPDGDWPDWVTLVQRAEPPAGAAWVGIGLRVQNQVAGDWVEAKDFSLSAVRF